LFAEQFAFALRKAAAAHRAIQHRFRIRSSFMDARVNIDPRLIRPHSETIIMRGKDAVRE